ncbi:MAG: hypothetical protein PHP75_07870, partial [Methylacidiphilaceae bacterium]|nr:hypothetical protein [Candidatus Methylacidiphilaceae bacterium]
GSTARGAGERYGPALGEEGRRSWAGPSRCRHRTGRMDNPAGGAPDAAKSTREQARGADWPAQDAAAGRRRRRRHPGEAEKTGEEPFP